VLAGVSGSMVYIRRSPTHHETLSAQGPHRKIINLRDHEVDLFRCGDYILRGSSAEHHR
jgi:uncharacterized HAD superfamily protein